MIELFTIPAKTAPSPGEWEYVLKMNFTQDGRAVDEVTGEDFVITGSASVANGVLTIPLGGKVTSQTPRVFDFLGKEWVLELDYAPINNSTTQCPATISAPSDGANMLGVWSNYGGQQRCLTTLLTVNSYDAKWSMVSGRRKIEMIRTINTTSKPSSNMKVEQNGIQIGTISDSVWSGFYRDRAIVTLGGMLGREDYNFGGTIYSFSIKTRSILPVFSQKLYQNEYLRNIPSKTRTMFEVIGPGGAGGAGANAFRGGKGGDGGQVFTYLAVANPSVSVALGQGGVGGAVVGGGVGFGAGTDGTDTQLRNQTSGTVVLATAPGGKGGVGSGGTQGADGANGGNGFGAKGGQGGFNVQPGDDGERGYVRVFYVEGT